MRFFVCKGEFIRAFFSANTCVFAFVKDDFYVHFPLRDAKLCPF